jgi:Tol biopolymer transport system component
MAELTIRQVQTPPNWEGQIRVSPDGKYIADVHGGTGDLWVVEILTGKQHPLTTEGKDYSQFASRPYWSPDSTRLAFNWIDRDGRSELREMGLDGSPSRVLLRARTGEGITPHDWSPDGKHVLAAIYNKDKMLELVVVSVADGTVRSLKKFPSPNLAPGRCLFMPDGLSVAYSRRTAEGDRERDVFLLHVDGSRESPLIQHPADDNFLEWLPGGQWVLFSSDRSGTMDLWTTMVEKGQPQGVPTLVKRSIGSVSSLGLTRQGAYYYSTPGSFMDVHTASLDPRTGVVVGSPKKEPLPFEGRNRWPDWSPDGKQLVYVSRRPGETQSVLCIYSADTGKVREFRLEKSYVYPRWAPDGRHLYLQAIGMDGQGIHRMDAQSGKVTPFMPAGEADYVHDLWVSADGKWIVYGRSRKPLYQVLRRDARSGQEQEIDRSSFDNFTLSLSRDGTHLAMILRPDPKTRVLKVMDFPDGTPKEIARFALEGSWIVDLTWSPDGRFIYYYDNPTSAQGNWHLRRISVEGGEPLELGVVRRYYDQLSAHPDGSRLTFSTPPIPGEPAQVWVMENFLPAAKGSK